MVLADQKQPKDWVACASSVPFICDRRIVIVRNLLRVDPLEVWDAKPKAKDHPFVLEIKSLPTTAMLILVADDETGDEDRQRRLETISKRWIELIQSGGGMVTSLVTDAKKVVEQLRTKAKEAGKQLSPSAAILLVEMTGGSFTIGLAELEKAILFVGNSEAITDSVIRAVVAPEQEYNVYQLVDAIVAGDAALAIKQMRVLIGSRDKMESQAFSRIFPTVARQFRMIWQARLCIEDNCPASNPSSKVLSLLPSKPRISEERDWPREKAVKAARKLRFEQIGSVFKELVAADARIKGMLPAYNTVDTVERMVLNMTAICRSR